MLIMINLLQDSDNSNPTAKLELLSGHGDQLILRISDQGREVAVSARELQVALETLRKLS